jgi:hypothetical protein
MSGVPNRLDVGSFGHFTIGWTDTLFSHITRAHSMNTRCSAFLVIALLVIAGTGPAQEKVPDNGKPPESPKAASMAVILYNGTLIRQLSFEGAVEIETPYGKMLIPAKEVRRIELGFRVPAEAAPKLEKALKNLTSDNFQAREAASQELIALGRLAFPSLQRMLKDKDLDTTQRIEKAIEEIRRKVPFDQLRETEEDLVTTKEATVRGRLLTNVFKGKAEHFGELTLPVAHVRELWAASGTTLVTVEPKNEGWVDTGVTVPNGSRLVLKATGRLTFELGDRKASSGPQGNTELRELIDRRGGGNNVGPAPGMLLGRVSLEGAELHVGARYDDLIERGGRLYLRISTGRQKNIPVTGNYLVEIDTDQR